MSLPKNEIKKRMIERAKDNPLVSYLCKQHGISRATYYRWIEADKKFKNEICKAQKIGRSAICDLAESKIINLVKSENENVSLNAAKYILNNNSPIYKGSNLSYQRMKLEDKIKKMENEKDGKIEEVLNYIRDLCISDRRKNNENEKIIDTADSESVIDKPLAVPKENQKHSDNSSSDSAIQDKKLNNNT